MIDWKLKMKYLVIILVLFIPFGLYAQKVRNVCGEFTYYAEGNQSPDEAKRNALEYARINAIQKEFGTVITQSTMQEETALDGKENSFFSQLNASEVKGEWLEDDGEPEYELSFVQNMMIVKCKVCGKAREITNDAAEFTATILRNGTEGKFADTRFRENDDMYLHFKSPVDGFIAVYAVDESLDVSCLLPYQYDTDGQQQVKHNEEYIFFSINKAKEEADLVDEYQLVCNEDVVRNRIYVIFSPNSFTKAVDEKVSDTLPRQLKFDDFQKWLTARRKRDIQMGIKVMHIDIRK